MPRAARLGDDDQAPSGDVREAVTRHVMCCSPSATEPTSDPYAIPSSNHATEEYARADARHPAWYDSSSGRSGRSCREGQEFCASQKQGTGQHGEGTSMEMYPYEVYCPTGVHHIPLGGLRVEEDTGSSRSPVADHPGGWAQVGSQNACDQHTVFDEVEDGGGGATAEGGGDGAAETEVATETLEKEDGDGEEQGVEEQPKSPIEPGLSAESNDQE